jgi:hypothetical protein
MGSSVGVRRGFDLDKGNRESGIGNRESQEKAIISSSHSLLPTPYSPFKSRGLYPVQWGLE